MKLYTDSGEEISLQELKGHSIVIGRVTKPMTQEEFQKFCKVNSHISDEFMGRGILLYWCPDWVEFKEWK